MTGTDRATFIVRLAREPEAPRWSGIVELVGTDLREAVSDASDVVAFIERRIAGREGDQREESV